METGWALIASKRGEECEKKKRGVQTGRSAGLEWVKWSVITGRGRKETGVKTTA